MLKTVLSCKVASCGKTARFHAILTWFPGNTGFHSDLPSVLSMVLPGRSRRRFSYSILL